MLEMKGLSLNAAEVLIGQWRFIQDMKADSRSLFTNLDLFYQHFGSSSSTGQVFRSALIAN